MTSERHFSRRQVLAYIALQNLPMPKEIQLDDGATKGLRLDLNVPAEVPAWAAAFGLDRAPYGDTWVRAAIRYEQLSTWGVWNGWRVTVGAVLRTPVPPVEELDEDSSAKLREIARGEP